MVDRRPPAFRNKAKTRKKVLYFISTGDTCRSPMAAAYFKQLLEERDIQNIEVRAAGVLTVTGLRASQEARQIMADHEVTLDRHLSSQLSADMIRRADLIMGMTPYHVQKAVRISEEARGRTHLLQEFTRSGGKNIQIQDPMGCTLEVFKKRFKEIRAACDKLIDSEFIIGPKPKVDKPKRAKKADKNPAAAKKPVAAAKNEKSKKPSKTKVKASATTTSAAAKTKKATSKAKKSETKAQAASQNKKTNAKPRSGAKNTRRQTRSSTAKA